MGKLSSRWIGGEDEDPDEKKRKLRKELDQIRKNALIRKREMRSKDSVAQKSKSNFMKTLNQFASQRRNIEESTHIPNGLINKGKIIKQETIKPIDLRGFFRGGVKGRQLKLRLDPEAEKFKNAILNNDSLKILQSGGLSHRSEENKKSDDYSKVKSPVENDHLEMRMEVARILENSSESSSLDLDNPKNIEFPSSPVIGRYKGAKKKISQVKKVVNEINTNLNSQENQFSYVNHDNKGERYRRRLFDETGVNNRHVEVSNNILCNNEASRNSTPENAIYHSEVIPKQNVNKSDEKLEKMDFTDPYLVKYYIETCKIVGENCFKDIFKIDYKDPEESAREALKSTYERALKEYVQHQNCPPNSVDRTTVSSNSEILLEPDSEIARRVKKVTAFQNQKEPSLTASGSTNSTKSSIPYANVSKQYPPSVNIIDDYTTKRKRAPSSKGDRSEVEPPFSTQAVADPKSVRADMKMNSIHPDRQELVARFLEDQKSFNSEATREIEKHHVHKEKLYIGDLSNGSYLVQKSTKYIPAILRKNRSLADCVAKEKATMLSIEKYPSQRNSNSTASELDLDILESERTPNTVTEQMIEAPKCKHVHKNAKYNPPPRMNIPIVPDNRHHRNPVPERHSQRYPSPNSVQQNFTISQVYNISPIKQVPDFADTSHDFRFCQLSQENNSQDNGNYMPRMVSFGDIQERTNRLTLCSQNQKCSQESSSMEHGYASQRSHPICHYQTCESSNNCNVSYKNQPHASFAEPSYERPSYECNSTLRCIERPSYIPKNECQMVPQTDYSYQEQSSSCSCCHQNPKEQQMISCAPPRQPIKFLAVEGNRRQPIYNPNESCSFVHKQPCCSSSRADSADFEYHEMLKMNYGGGDRPQSFAPLNGNQRYIVQMQMPPSPPVCQQVAHRHSHCSTNEAYKMNDAFLHQMNRPMHSKRQ